MHRLDCMDEGSLPPDILSDNIHDALQELAILGVAIGLLECRSSLQVWAIWACHLPLQVAAFAVLITLLFARPCWLETCLLGGGEGGGGGGFTFRHVVLPLGVPSFAPICGGLHGQALYLFAAVCTARQD